MRLAWAVGVACPAIVAQAINSATRPATPTTAEATTTATPSSLGHRFDAVTLRSVAAPRMEAAWEHISGLGDAIMLIGPCTATHPTGARAIVGFRASYVRTP